MDKNIRDEVISMLCKEFDLEKESINNIQESLLINGIIDSFEFAKFIFVVEEFFDIEISFEEYGIEYLSTIDGLVKVIEGLVQ